MNRITVRWIRSLALAAALLLCPPPSAFGDEPETPTHGGTLANGEGGPSPRAEAKPEPSTEPDPEPKKPKTQIFPSLRVPWESGQKLLTEVEETWSKFLPAKDAPRVEKDARTILSKAATDRELLRAAERLNTTGLNTRKEGSSLAQDILKIAWLKAQADGDETRENRLESVIEAIDKQNAGQ